PEELPFFSKHGEISDCAALVFCVDIADSKSSEDFYMWMKKARRSLRRMPPILIVGTKVDERSFRVTTPYIWGQGVANIYSARGYLECSAKNNERVDRVLDTILKMVV
ncbi:uncharacterized protein NPIL_20911, partial [Nephila pilipes]